MAEGVTIREAMRLWKSIEPTMTIIRLHSGETGLPYYLVKAHFEVSEPKYVLDPQKYRNRYNFIGYMIKKDEITKEDIQKAKIKIRRFFVKNALHGTYTRKIKKRGRKRKYRTYKIDYRKVVPIVNQERIKEIKKERIQRLLYFVDEVLEDLQAGKRGII